MYYILAVSTIDVFWCNYLQVHDHVTIIMFQHRKHTAYTYKLTVYLMY